MAGCHRFFHLCRHTSFQCGLAIPPVKKVAFIFLPLKSGSCHVLALVSGMLANTVQAEA